MNQFIKKYLAALYFICNLFILSITTLSRLRANFWRRYPKGIDNPFNTSGCKYLYVGAVYVVLGGSPTSSIILVSSLREIPTFAMLHHPFLFGEILT